MKDTVRAAFRADREEDEDLVADLHPRILVDPPGDELDHLADEGPQVGVRDGLFDGDEIDPFGAAGRFGVALLQVDPAGCGETELLARLDVDPRVHPAGGGRDGDRFLEKRRDGDGLDRVLSRESRGGESCDPEGRGENDPKTGFRAHRVTILSIPPLSGNPEPTPRKSVV